MFFSNTTVIANLIYFLSYNYFLNICHLIGKGIQIYNMMTSIKGDKSTFSLKILGPWQAEHKSSYQH